MSGDYSRQRFDPRKQFSAVLMQQGRVQLDADWNEQGAILDRRWRAETIDLIGRSGVPKEVPDGFKIVATGATFTIAPGRIYVNGVLAENYGQGPAVFDQVLAEVRGTTAVPYAQQPYFPNPPPLLPGGRHLVYLDVWQREITAIEDPDLIEPAIGVDSTARLQTVWQVKVLPNVGANVTSTTPDAEIPGWSAVLAPSAGRLSTLQDGVSGVSADRRLLSPGADYTGLENQLYRIEIHEGGPLGAATFKWSRDNATVATQVLAIPRLDQLVVDSTGRDAVLRFNAGDWVEITHDTRELQGLPGEMRQIKTVDEATRTLILEQPLPQGVFATSTRGQTDPTQHTRVRRWDQHGKVLDVNGNVLVDLDEPGQPGVILTGTSVVLEHGVSIAFDMAAADGTFRTGDYWVLATRTADASVEHLEQAPPRGIHHHYSRLALLRVESNGQVTGNEDCRRLFPHGLLAITTGEVLFQSVPSGQEVSSGNIDSGLGSGPICVVLGMTQTQGSVVTVGNIPQISLTADVDPPSGQFKVRALRQAQGVASLLVQWWALRPERHLGQVIVSPGVLVVVTPAQLTLQAGATQQFTATATGTANTAVTWSVNNITGGNTTVGTITTAGLYQAPAVTTSTTVTIRATSVADSTRSATATVTIQPQVVVTVAPPTPTVNLGAQQQFTATVTGTANTAVTWSVNNITGGNTTVGTITATGLYQAPGVVPTPATVTVRATSVADSTRSATATVTVQSVVQMTVSPPTASVTAGTQRQFTAFVSGTTNTAVTWRVNNIGGGNTTVGTISAAGLYQAPALTTPTSVTVSATSVADTTRGATANVTVQPVIVVTVSPTAVTLNVGQPQQFTAQVSGSSNTAVTWSVTGAGTISQAGLYQAPATMQTPATVTVRATSQADSTKSATATVTVRAVSVSVTPFSALLRPGRSQDFDATVSNATNTAVTWSVQESLGGSVNQNGLYTAPGRVGTFTVRATSVADTSKSDTASIDVDSEPEPKLAAEKTTDILRSASPSTAASTPRQRSRRGGQAPQPRTPRRRPRAEQRAFIRPEERPEVES